MKEVPITRTTALGQASNAGKIKPVTCKEMVALYDK